LVFFFIQVFLQRFRGGRFRRLPPISKKKMALKKFTYPGSFCTQSGAVLPVLQLAYTTHGTLNAGADNVVWIFHALTANSDPAEWWPGLVGAGKFFDPSRYFIICVNTPGGCYGSTGPLDTNPATGQPYYHDFPYFTINDMIRAYQPLRKALGIQRIFAGLGGSMGGMQLLEWAVTEPGLFQHIIPLATNAQHSPWGIAFNATQRMCIEADTTWAEKNESAGMNGLKAARATALLSYRHYDTYGHTQPRTETINTAELSSDSYQRYQGEKLARRFNAFSYYVLSQSMDSQDLGRGRGSVAGALKQITAKALIISIDTDVLYPPAEQQLLAAEIPGAQYAPIHSLYGHDGFLLEYEQIEQLLAGFLPVNHIHENEQQPMNTVTN
jgi:homoserine O-acetyltransferase/O-succinyltransferase